MRWASPYTPEQRARAERLVRETARPMTAIAAELGIRHRTLQHWAAAGGWRAPPPGPEHPASWPAARRAAVVRICCEPRVDRQDVARALGIGRTGAAAFFRALDLPARRRPSAGPAANPVPGRALPDAAPLDPASAADGPTLRAALRGHVARQIAAFDAALAEGAPAVIDSARVLRDLGGLKRLLDELAQAQEGDDADGYGADDLPALRADLARRLGGLGGGLGGELGGGLGDGLGGIGPYGSGSCARRPAAPGAAGAGA